ncbi:MAG: F0F1 ATP synthase subunit gamma, partial [Proteobacteria bacterium]
SLLTALLRQYFFVSISRACAESQASEHASRLNTMQSAQKNLDERIDEVTMQYRRLRQEAITTELLDVVSGFEAATATNHD